MIRLLLRIFAFCPRTTPKTEAEILSEKIRKWERQADEYDAMGLTELARQSRSSLEWYRRKLSALERRPFRRVA